ELVDGKHGAPRNAPENKTPARRKVVIVFYQVEMNRSLHRSKDCDSQGHRPLRNQTDLIGNLRLLFFYAGVIHKLLNTCRRDTACCVSCMLRRNTYSYLVHHRHREDAACCVSTHWLSPSVQMQSP